jgi:hypothetical protein
LGEEQSKIVLKEKEGNNGRFILTRVVAETPSRIADRSSGFCRILVGAQVNAPTSSNKISMGRCVKRFAPPVYVRPTSTSDCGLEGDIMKALLDTNVFLRLFSLRKEPMKLKSCY